MPGPGDADKPKRRFMRLLRRGAREPQPVRDAVEESALWATHQRALTAAREAGESAQRIAAHLAKQRSVVDSSGDRTRAVSARSTDLGAAFARLKDSFARLELVALNAGLEGARLGEGPGQALNLVADEIRAQAARGSEACRELGTTLGEIGSELAQVHASLDRVREASAEVAQEAACVGGAASDAERSLSDMGERLTKATGSDPETANAITEATDAARKLVTTLGELRGRAPQAIMVKALRPILEPLVRLLEDDGDREAGR